MSTICETMPRSWETEKNAHLAVQAAIKEDIEQRRRRLDTKGESRKIVVGKEVAHMIDEFGPSVHLHKPQPPPPKKESSMNKVISDALKTSQGLIKSATEATKHAVNEMVQDAASALNKTASFVGHVSKDTAAALSSAAGKIGNAATEAAHKAVDITEKVVDKTSHKAHELVDNLTSFTALVGVLAAEERERNRRLTEDETCAILNALKVTELIRGFGGFFPAEQINLRYTAKLLEESERRCRLLPPYSTMAASQAHSVGKLVSSNVEAFQHFIPHHLAVMQYIHNLEEKERTRRMNDSDEVYAIMNALATRDLIRGLGWEFYRQEGRFDKLHAAYATTLLEENERRWRIRTEKMIHVEDNAHLLMDVVAVNLAKFNLSTRQAAHFVNEFASKLGKATFHTATIFSERTKEFAKTTASRVQAFAGDITNFATMLYVLSLEERERVRRMNDPDESTAILNAWRQSSIIRNMEGFYRQGHPSRDARFPSIYHEELERCWRMNHDDKDTKERARAVADIVRNNISKFERAHEYAAELMRKREVASHSRLNVKSVPFIPAKKPTIFASGAQV